MTFIISFFGDTKLNFLNQGGRGLELFCSWLFCMSRAHEILAGKGRFSRYILSVMLSGVHLLVGYTVQIVAEWQYLH